MNGLRSRSLKIGADGSPKKKSKNLIPESPKSDTDRSDSQASTSVFGSIDQGISGTSGTSGSDPQIAARALQKQSLASSLSHAKMSSSLYSVSTASETGRTFPVKASKTILTTLAACMVSVIFLEYIIKNDPGAGILITFGQFIFVSITGAFTWWQFGRRSNQVPMKYHILTVVLFWSVNFCNNLAFKYSIPMTLHTIFRSGSLVTNMLLGMLFAGKRYKYDKYISVFMISCGIFICTLMSASASAQEKGSDGDADADSADEGYGMVLGIMLLVYALVVSSVMGLIQEVTYKKFGKHPDEALFIDHVLGLPFFYFFSSQIFESFSKLAESEPAEIDLNFFGFGILKIPWLPIGILFLIVNILTSYGCIKSVFILTTECTSLTVTLVITVRKFLTLMVSIFYFGNAFSVLHWVGTFMVFCGALVYAEIISLDRLLFSADGKNSKVEGKDQ